MSIPLVQNNDKDAINTSIIAIKRNIERINMLLGLVDSGSPDLSGLATKQELQDAISQVETDLTPVDEVTVGNMQSVTSNAVAEALLDRSSVYEEDFINMIAGTGWGNVKSIVIPPRKTISGQIFANISTNNSGQVYIQARTIYPSTVDSVDIMSSYFNLGYIGNYGYVSMSYTYTNESDSNKTIYLACYCGNIAKARSLNSRYTIF